MPFAIAIANTIELQVFFPYALKSPCWIDYKLADITYTRILSVTISLLSILLPIGGKPPAAHLISIRALAVD